MERTVEINGVCARRVTFSVEDGVVKSVSFSGGCNGNGKGIARLVEGMEVDRVISALTGVKCGAKGTSCPEQLAFALKNL